MHTNDDTLSAEDMALGYRQLQRVQQGWRQMKSGLGLRPIYHRAERRIRAHVALTVLALLLEWNNEFEQTQDMSLFADPLIRHEF